MADMSLAETSAFANWSRVRGEGIAIETRDDLAIVGITAFAGRTGEVGDRFKAEYGIDLPSRPAAAPGDDITMLWAGPGQWLAIAQRRKNGDLEAELKAALDGVAAIVDHSDGRAVLTVSGSRARDVLAKGFNIDLHPRAFKTNDLAITQANHIGALIWQTGDEPSYLIAVFRSFADSFADWLTHAAAEYSRA